MTESINMDSAPGDGEALLLPDLDLWTPAPPPLALAADSVIWAKNAVEQFWRGYREAVLAAFASSYPFSSSPQVEVKERLLLSIPGANSDVALVVVPAVIIESTLLIITTVS